MLAAICVPPFSEEVGIPLVRTFRDAGAVPHITIGRFAAANDAAAVAAMIGGKCGCASGRAEAVKVVQVHGDLVRQVHRQPLGAGSPGQ